MMQRGAARPGEREPALDLMRIVGAFAVVMIHVSAVPVAAVDPSSVGWWVANFSNAGSRWGDAIIIMAAGAILLGRPSDQAPLDFVKTRYVRLLPAVVLWTTFYLLWRLWTTGALSAEEVAFDLLRGMPYYHMWFLYMMLGMYLVIPLIRALVRLTDARLQYYLLGLCALLTPVEGLSRVIQGMTHASFLGLFPIYLVYLIGGYLLYRDRPSIPTWVLLLVPCLCIVVEAIGVAFLHPVIGEPIFKLMYSNRGPLVMVATFCLFVLALRAVEKAPARAAALHRNGGEYLARVTLGIYVLHPFWIDVLARHGAGTPGGEPWYAVPTQALLVFVLSACSSLALSRVPALRRTVM